MKMQKFKKAWDNFLELLSGAVEVTLEGLKALVGVGSAAGLVVALATIFLFFIAIGPWIVMNLWNWLIPGIIGWREINFWEAFGILIVCRILFGGRSSSSSEK